VAVEGDPTPVGYELLDDNKILRMWNEVDSYFFNVSNSMQFSNHYLEWWSWNVFGIGYYASGEWNVLYWTDSLSGFEKSVDTDWESYVNATLWKDLSSTIGSNTYNYRLAIRYHLKRSDGSLTVQPYIKNLGVPIPVDVGFAWRIKDVQVANDAENDKFSVSWSSGPSATGEYYLLNQTLNKTYENSTHPFLMGYQIIDVVQNKTLELWWTTKILDRYKLVVKTAGGQYNAPITVLINVGQLSAGQEKTTDFLWKDADLIDSYASANRDGNLNIIDLWGGSDAESAGGQSFNCTGGNYNISSIKWELARTATAPTCNTYAELYAHSGIFGTSSLPTGSALATSDPINASTLPTSWGTLTEYTFSTTYEMVENTLYCLVLRTGTTGIINGTHKIWLATDQSSPSHDGNFIHYDDFENNWVATAGYDAIFYVYGDPINTAPVNNAVYIINMDDTNYCYSKEKAYNFVLNCSDADDDLDDLGLRFNDGLGSNVTIYVNNASLSVTVSAGSAYVSVGSATRVIDAGSNSVNITLPITLDWDIGDGSNLELYIYCNDTNGAEDTWEEKQTNYFNIESDIEVDTATASDAHCDPSDSLTITGQIYYQGSSSVVPPNSENILLTENVTSQTALMGASGSYSISITASSSVATTVYNVYGNVSIAGTNKTASIVTDQMKVTDYTITLSTPKISLKMQYALDDSVIVGGTVSYAGLTANTDGTGWADITLTSASDFDYNTQAYPTTDPLYGLTSMGENQTVPMARATYLIEGSSTLTLSSVSYVAGNTKQLSFTGTGTAGQESILIYGGKPYYVTIDDVVRSDGDHWRWEASITNITDTFSTKDFMVSWIAYAGDGGGGGGGGGPAKPPVTDEAVEEFIETVVKPAIIKLPSYAVGLTPLGLLLVGAGLAYRYDQENVAWGLGAFATIYALDLFMVWILMPMGAYPTDLMAVQPYLIEPPTLSLELYGLSIAEQEFLQITILTILFATLAGGIALIVWRPEG